MRRRDLALGGLSSLAVGGMLRARRARAAETGLSVEVETAAGTFVFNQSTGADLGDYTDPGGQFVQGCVRADHPDVPLSVFFRGDRASKRAEIVFELGRTWSGTPAHMGPYEARILSNGDVATKVAVPQHYWFSRWRLQSAPRPVRVTAAELFEAGLVPRLNPSRLGSRPRKPQQYFPYRPMELAGLSMAMGTTGERPDIGPLTESQAEYLCTKDPLALDILLAQADAASTFPWIIRDEKTHAPLDAMAYPKATLYGERKGTPFIRSIPAPVRPDQAHQPALGYLPFLLTGDPYFLETLQFQSAFSLLTRPQEYRHRTGQVRTAAWSLRSWGQVARATPVEVPRWLLPRNRWQVLLDDQRSWMTDAFLNSTESSRRIFRTTDMQFGDSDTGDMQKETFISPWMEDFLTFIMGWLVLMGHRQWEPLFRWSAGQVIARTNGTSGWPRAYCTPYRIALRENRSANWATNWAEAWELTQRKAHLPPPTSDQWVTDQFASYLQYARGVLAMADHLGMAEARPSLDWVNGELQRIEPVRGPYYYKWAYF